MTRFTKSGQFEDLEYPRPFNDPGRLELLESESDWTAWMQLGERSVFLFLDTWTGKVVPLQASPDSEMTLAQELYRQLNSDPNLGLPSNFVCRHLDVTSLTSRAQLLEFTGRDRGVIKRLVVDGQVVSTSNEVSQFEKARKYLDIQQRLPSVGRVNPLPPSLSPSQHRSLNRILKNRFWTTMNPEREEELQGNLLKALFQNPERALRYWKAASLVPSPMFAQLASQAHEVDRILDGLDSDSLQAYERFFRLVAPITSGETMANRFVRRWVELERSDWDTAEEFLNFLSRPLDVNGNSPAAGVVLNPNERVTSSVEIPNQWRIYVEFFQQEHLESLFHEISPRAPPPRQKKNRLSFSCFSFRESPGFN